MRLEAPEFRKCPCCGRLSILSNRNIYVCTSGKHRFTLR